MEDVAVDEGIVQVTGECLIDGSANVSSLRLDRIDLVGLHGEPLKGGAVYVHVDAPVLGTRFIPYSVRVKVPHGPA